MSDSLLSLTGSPLHRVLIFFGHGGVPKAIDSSHPIDPIHKGVSLFLSYTNMNTMNNLHHVKEHPKISDFLQFES